MNKPLTKIFVILLVLLLTACTPLAGTGQPTLPTRTSLPAATKISTLQPSPQTIDELQDIIEASNPKYSRYDPQSAAFAEFPEAVKQVSSMGLNGVDAADDLALAITFPRQDSYLAAQALISLGPDITVTEMPILLDNLHNPKPEAHAYLLIVLGSVGSQASCGVGKIAPLLWDSDPQVRTATALALERITNQELIPSEYEITIDPSFLVRSIMADTPNGTIVSTARIWWYEQGSKVNWHPSYDLCDP